MEAAYILEPGAYIRREGACLNVMKGKTTLDRIPAEGLKRLTLIGYVSLTGSVLDYLIQKRIETIFITPTGRFRARLGLDEHRHVALRKAQYLNLSTPGFALATAKDIVLGKITNMYQFMLGKDRSAPSDAVKFAAIRLKSAAAAIPTVTDMQKLRGMEGLASRIYFEAFPHLIQNPLFTFKERNKRPPLDPVNALLSFVYTLLTNEVQSAIKTCGLDPYMGSLHEIDYGRPSLACDLVEEYRCFLGDRLVLSLINKKMISPDDFVYRDAVPSEFADEQEMKAKRPVEMKPQTMKTFIASYEEMMKRSIRYPLLDKKISYRWLLMNQARQFGDYLENPEKRYQPFIWKG